MATLWEVFLNTFYMAQTILCLNSTITIQKRTRLLEKRIKNTYLEEFCIMQTKSWDNHILTALFIAVHTKLWIHWPILTNNSASLYLLLSHHICHELIIKTNLFHHWNAWANVMHAIVTMILLMTKIFSRPDHETHTLTHSSTPVGRHSKLSGWQF